MSTLSNSVNIDIQHPEQWSLSIRIDSKCVRFVVHCDAERESLMSHVVELDKNEENFLQSLEGCIYDNPFFLQDFKQVKVTVNSMRFMIVPKELCDAEMKEQMFATMYGTPDGDIECNTLGENCPAVIYEMSRGLHSFLNRTFNNPPVRHHLSAPCEYFASLSRNANVNRLYAYLHDGIADLFVFKKDRFVFANSFEYREADDAIFFILNAWHDAALDVFNDELQLVGDKPMRDAIAPMLREYITYVMPVIFPADAMRIGKDSMKAPFDLILMALCE